MSTLFKHTTNHEISTFKQQALSEQTHQHTTSQILSQDDFFTAVQKGILVLPSEEKALKPLFVPEGIKSFFYLTYKELCTPQGERQNTSETSEQIKETFFRYIKNIEEENASISIMLLEKNSLRLQE